MCFAERIARTIGWRPRGVQCGRARPRFSDAGGADRDRTEDQARTHRTARSPAPGAGPCRRLSLVCQGRSRQCVVVTRQSREPARSGTKTHWLHEFEQQDLLGYCSGRSGRVAPADAARVPSSLCKASAARRRDKTKPRMNADRLNALSEQIVQCAFVVSNTPGSGILEKVWTGNRLGARGAQDGSGCRATMMAYGHRRRRRAASLTAPSTEAC